MEALRARLGRMLGRFGPVDETELLTAMQALTRMASAPDPAAHVARTPWHPPALPPLLLHHWQHAAQRGDMGLAEGLERVYGHLSALDTHVRPFSPGDVRTPSHLARFLLQQNPGLEQELIAGRTLAAALIVRHWAAQHMPICVDRRLLVEPADAVSAFRAFHELTGAVWCGGAALYYAHLLRVFGIPAATFAYAYESPDHHISHVTTIVHASDGRFYPQDAYLNYHYEDAAGGATLDLGELLQRIRAGAFTSIRQRTQPIVRPYVLCRDERAAGHFGTGSMPVSAATETPHGLLACAVGLTQDDLPGWNAVVDRHRGADSRHEFLLKVMLTTQRFGSFGDADTDARFAALLSVV